MIEWQCISMTTHCAWKCSLPPTLFLFVSLFAHCTNQERQIDLLLWYVELMLSLSLPLSLLSLSLSLSRSLSR